MLWGEEEKSERPEIMVCGSPLPPQFGDFRACPASLFFRRILRPRLLHPHHAHLHALLCTSNMNVVDLLKQVTDLIDKVQDTLPQPSAPFLQPGALATARSLDLSMPAKNIASQTFSLRPYDRWQEVDVCFYQKQTSKLQRVYQKDSTTQLLVFNRQGHVTRLS